MKHLLYILVIFTLLGLAMSCDNAPHFPGDYNKKSTLSIDGPAVSHRTGRAFEVAVARESDTVYRYLYILRDTVLDDSGEPLINSNGEYEYRYDSVYVLSKIKARLVELAPLYLPSHTDTFSIDINSNARWIAGVPVYESHESRWYFNITATGGGDSRFDFRTTRNRQTLRVKWQEIITSDSSVMYRIPVAQYGDKDQPADFESN